MRGLSQELSSLICLPHYLICSQIVQSHNAFQHLLRQLSLRTVHKLKLSKLWHTTHAPTLSFCPALPEKKSMLPFFSGADQCWVGYNSWNHICSNNFSALRGTRFLAQARIAACMRLEYGQFLLASCNPQKGKLVLGVSWCADKFAADPDAPAIAILSYHLCYLAKSAAKTLNSRNIKGTFLPKNAVLAGFTFLHNDII